MARFKRISLWTSLALLLLLVPVAIGSYWLLNTRAGADWALNLVQKYAPVAINYDELHGSLWRGLTFRQLHVSVTAPLSPLKTIEAPALGFRWNPMALLHGQLRLKQLHLKGSRVTLQQESQPTKNNSITLPRIDLPISIQATGVDIENNSLIVNNKEFLLPDVRANVRLQSSTLTISRLDLRYQHETLLADITVDFAEKLTFDIKERHNGQIALKGHCQNEQTLQCLATLDWQAFNHPITGPTEFPKGHLSAKLNDQQILVEGNTAVHYADIQTTAELKTTIDLSQKYLTLKTLNAALQEGKLSASGHLSWQTPITAELRTQLENVDLSSWTQPTVKKTEVSLETVASLRLEEQLALTTHTQISRLKIGNQKLTGDLNAALHGQQITLKKLQLNSQNAELSAHGRYHLNSQAVELQLTSQIEHLANFLPQYAGNIDLNLSLKGALNKPRLELQTHAKNLAIATVKAEAITLQTQLHSEADTVSYPALIKNLGVDQWHLKSQNLLINQTAIDRAELTISGDLNKHHITFNADTLPGNVDLHTLDFTGALTLPISNQATTHQTQAIDWPSARWAIDLQQLQFNHAGADSEHPVKLKKPTRIQLSSKHSHTADLCLLKSDVQLCIEQLSYDGDGSFDAGIELTSAYLDRNRTLFPTLYSNIPGGWDIDGEVVASVKAEGRYRDGQLRITTNNRLAVDDAHIRYTDTENPGSNQDYALETVEVTLKGTEQQLRLIGEIKQQQTQQINVSGLFTHWTTAERLIDLQLSGQIEELRPLQLALPAVRELTGAAQFEARLKRDSKQPDAVITGNVALNKLGLFVPTYGTRVENVNIKLDATQDTIAVNGDGNIGEGSLRLKGQMALNEQQKLTTDISLLSEKITLVNLPDSRLNASTQLTLVGDGLYRWHLGGEITAMDSFLHLQEVPSSAVRVSNDAEIFGTETSRRTSPVEFTSDVQIIAGDNIHFNGFGLTTNISGRLQYTRDRNQSNQLQGALTIPSGRFKAYGQDLGVENGQIIFAGSTSNPSLDIRAARKIDDITAGIWLHGSARNLKTSLYAEPDMSNAETLSYILTGKPLNRSPDDEGTDMQAAALALGLKQALPALQKIGNQLGLSDISVESGPQGKGSSIAAGKRLNDRLYVKYEYGLVGAVGRLVIEYALTKRLKLEASSGASGESDAFDITYTWNSTPPELEKDAEQDENRDEAKNENATKR